MAASAVPRARPRARAPLDRPGRRDVTAAPPDPRPWLGELDERLADAEEDTLATALVTLAALAGNGVTIEGDERRSAARRALLVLAAGGDPSRGLDLNGPAVERLADELDAADRRAALVDGLTELRRRAEGLPHVTEVIYGLLDAPDVAWRAYACSLLAEELDE